MTFLPRGVLAAPLGKCATEFRQSFEETFTEVVLKHSSGGGAGPFTPDSLTLLENQRVLAQFFSRFILTNPNNYSKLLTLIHGCKRALFGSLNYECLLEQAAENLGMQVDYACETDSFDVASVAKLHGSCNFVVEVPASAKAILASQNIQLGMNLIYLPVFNLELELNRRFSASDPAYYPVMSQVSPMKEHLVAPGRILGIRGKWEEGISNAAKLAIIGVSYNKNDSHVLQPIQKARCPVFYIGGKADFASWHALNSNVEHISDTLENGLGELAHAVGLT